MQNYCNIVKNKLNMLIRNMEKNVSDFVVDPKRDFVRKSELSFSKTMKFILGMGSQSLGSELMEFYGLDQKSVSVSAVAKQLNISPHQLSYVTNSGAGEGLIFYGNVIIPFVDKFPKDTQLYKIMTTKPEEQEEN